MELSADPREALALADETGDSHVVTNALNCLATITSSSAITTHTTCSAGPPPWSTTPVSGFWKRTRWLCSPSSTQSEAGQDVVAEQPLTG